jgi:hypothetical protein
MEVVPVPWKSVVYRRTDLYAEVWQEPVRTIAKRYGISDVALVKICRKLEVPLPGRGYWARTAAGQTIPATPLPALKHGQPAQYTSARRLEPDEPSLVDAEIASRVEAERDPSKAIVVAEALEAPHPLVRMSASIIRRTSFEEEAKQRNRCLDMHVSKGALDRALRIMDALLKALEARGFEIEVTESENPEPLPRYSYERRPSRTGVVIGEQFVQFGMEEKADAVEPPPSRPGSYEYRPRYVRHPNGRLTLCLRSRAYSQERQVWSDGKRQRIESCLNDFVAALIATAESMRLAAIRAEEERKRWLEAQRETEAAHRQRAAHQVLVHDLDQRIDLLRKAQDIRAFADRLTEGAEGDASPSTDALRLADWLQWAHARAARLERRALTGILKRKHDISGRSELTARFGWNTKPSSVELLSVVFHPYETGSKEDDASS